MWDTRWCVMRDDMFSPATRRHPTLTLLLSLSFSGDDTANSKQEQGSALNLNLKLQRNLLKSITIIINQLL